VLGGVSSTIPRRSIENKGKLALPFQRQLNGWGRTQGTVPITEAPTAASRAALHDLLIAYNEIERAFPVSDVRGCMRRD